MDLPDTTWKGDSADMKREPAEQEGEHLPEEHPKEEASPPMETDQVDDRGGESPVDSPLVIDENSSPPATPVGMEILDAPSEDEGATAPCDGTPATREPEPAPES